MFPHMVAGLAALMFTAPAPECALEALPGLSRQYNALIRADAGSSSAAKATEFQRLAESVIGSSLPEGVDWATPGAIPCDSNVRRRDHIASQMAMVGHSAREISDVLRGHLTVGDLDAAQARLMAGLTRTQVAEFLESRWREPIASPPVSEPAAAEPVTLAVARLPLEISTELERLAKKYQVPTNLIRAMVAAESGGNARAISRAGAIGLMQLMPATAAALGVDPWHPLENLRGGVQYFAELLRAYDHNPRLALIAYNAGPQHANRVKAGTAVAYRETRRYLDAIAATYPLP